MLEDVLIVLGYNTNPEHPVFQARLDKAVELYHQGTAPQIIMSGCASFKLKQRPKISEAACMRDYAVDKGVPGSAIFLEEESVDTLGNFYYSKIHYLMPCSWYRVGVVSDPWHVWRSEWLAAIVLGPDSHITSYPSPQPRGWDSESIRASEDYNRKLLIQTQELLVDVEAGDHQAIQPFLSQVPAQWASPARD